MMRSLSLGLIAGAVLFACNGGDPDPEAEGGAGEAGSGDAGEDGSGGTSGAGSGGTSSGGSTSGGSGGSSSGGTDTGGSSSGGSSSGGSDVGGSSTGGSSGSGSGAAAGIVPHVLIDGEVMEEDGLFEIAGRVVAFVGKPDDPLSSVKDIKTVDETLEVVDQLEFDLYRGVGGLQVAKDKSSAAWWNHESGDFGDSLWIFDGTAQGTRKVMENVHALSTSIEFGAGYALGMVLDPRDGTDTPDRALRVHLSVPSAEILPLPSDVKSFNPVAMGANRAYGNAILTEDGSRAIGALVLDTLKYEHIFELPPGARCEPQTSTYSEPGVMAYLDCDPTVYSTDSTGMLTNPAFVKPNGCSITEFINLGGQPYFTACASDGTSEQSVYVLGATTSGTTELYTTTRDADGIAYAPTDTTEGGEALFNAPSMTTKTPAIWVTDGTKAGTRIFVELPKILIQSFARVGAWVYFGAVDQTENKARMALYRTDGKGKVEEITLGFSLARSAGPFFRLGNQLVFGLYPTGENLQLWAIDNAGDD